MPYLISFTFMSVVLAMGYELSRDVLRAAQLTRELQSSAAALRESEERYREVVESQTDLVCRHLADSTLTFVNDACCRFLGRRQEELLGRKLLELLSAPPNSA